MIFLCIARFSIQSYQIMVIEPFVIGIKKWIGLAKAADIPNPSRRMCALVLGCS